MASRVQRLPPAGSRAGAPQLRPDLPALAGRLRVQPTGTGFDWWFEPNAFSRVQARTSGSLALALAAGPGRRPPLRVERPDLDHGFARLHDQVRERRRRLVASLVQEAGSAKGWEASEEPRPAAYHAALFPRVHAFTGAVSLHWHPQGRAVAAVWRAVRELGALLPDALIRIPASWETARKARPEPWDRLDYGRSRAELSVHPLVPTRPASLPAPPP